MSPTPEKKIKKHGDIQLVSEIIAYFMYWQDTCKFWKNAIFKLS